MDKFEKWLESMIKMCDMDRQAVIQKYSDTVVDFMHPDITVRKKTLEHCLKKYREFKRQEAEK